MQCSSRAASGPAGAVASHSHKPICVASSRSAALSRRSSRFGVLPAASPCWSRCHRRRLAVALPSASGRDADDGLDTDNEMIMDVDVDPATEQGVQAGADVEETVVVVDEAASSDRSVTARQRASSTPEVSVSSSSRNSGPELSPEFIEKAKLGALGVAALAVFGGAAFYARKMANTQLPKVKQVMEKRQLQKESMNRLNGFIEEVRNSASADLSAKNLGEEGCQYIAEAFAFNDRCKAADLGKNGIGLKGISQLCEALTQNDKLETLVLETNSIGDEGAQVIAAFMEGNSSIRKLDLSGNNIQDEGAQALASMLERNTTLETLDLNSNGVDAKGAAALGRALANNTSLRVLGISDNYLEDSGAVMLSDHLSSNGSLQELSLKGNEIGDDGVAALCKALQDRSGSLKSLDIGRNSIGQVGVDAIAEWLTASGSKGVTELNFWSMDLDDAAIKKLAPALAKCSSLKSLDLSGNTIGSGGVKALMEAMRKLESLRSLELGYNPIGPEGCKAVAEAVKYDLQLETLKMGWCQVGDGDGARAVADLLMFNSTLQQLDLRGNKLGNDGAIIVGRAMREHQNEQLRELDLGYNEIKDDGACAIAQALKANPNGAPKELKVNSNYLTRFGQVALTEALDMVYEMGGGREIVITY